MSPMLLSVLTGIQKAWERWRPARKLVRIEGDSLPRVMPRRDLVLAQDGDEDWCVGMLCPCGCGRTIELLVIPEANPRWSVTTDAKGRPSLRPSVWVKDGCKSHFWVREGRIQWCPKT
jgi:hypothetical protein